MSHTWVTWVHNDKRQRTHSMTWKQRTQLFVSCSSESAINKMLGDRIMERHLLNGRVDSVKDDRVRVSTRVGSFASCNQNSLPILKLWDTYKGGAWEVCDTMRDEFFFVWMLHGSTKVVVRAVALLSAKTKWKVANTLERFFPRKQQIRNNTTKQNHQPQCSLPESAGKGGWSQFLGRLDQGLVGNAESTHVNRPRGKATLVP